MKELTREDIVNAANEMRFFEKMRFINYLAKLIDCKKSGLMAGLASSMVLDEAREDFIKNKLTELLDMIESAGDTLYSVVLLKEQRQKKMFIKNFFSNLIVWGIKENVDHFDDLYHFSTVNIHRNITDAIEFLDSFLSSQELQGAKEQPIIQMVVTLRDLFKIMSNNIKCIEVKKN